jgi:ABC-2 type transport system ATP-binding protein
MIETFGLCKRFGEKCAVDHLTLAAQPGEVTGFLGPNGSGKTTTIRLLMGLLRPSEGRASILGRDCQAEGTALKRDVGYLPEEPFLYPYLTGRELLEFVAGLHGFSRAEARRRASAGLERFGLTAEQNGFSITYSLGTRKRLALAAALIHDPSVLVLDEPTNGLE